MMKEFWDQRYSEPGFAYGRAANEFFRDELIKLEPGKLLLPGEGEGRNAVFAAGRGWEVTAFDYSAAGKKKALEWAKSLGLIIDYRLEDLSGFNCTELNGYDCLAIIFIHLPPDLRQSVHRELVKCLKPGGTLLLECFHKDQLKYGTGGPPSLELLYSTDELLEDFQEMDIRSCRQENLEMRSSRPESHEFRSSERKNGSLKSACPGPENLHTRRSSTGTP